MGQKKRETVSTFTATIDCNASARTIASLYNLYIHVQEPLCQSLSKPKLPNMLVTMITKGCNFYKTYTKKHTKCLLSIANTFTKRKGRPFLSHQLQ